MPIHRGVKSNAIEPSRNARIALKSRQGPPGLQQDFLSQILSFLAGKCVCASDFHDGSAMLLQPFQKNRVLIIVVHREALSRPHFSPTSRQDVCENVGYRYWYLEQTSTYKNRQNYFETHAVIDRRPLVGESTGVNG